MDKSFHHPSVVVKLSVLGKSSKWIARIPKSQLWMQSCAVDPSLTIISYCAFHWPQFYRNMALRYPKLHLWDDRTVHAYRLLYAESSYRCVSQQTFPIILWRRAFRGEFSTVVPPVPVVLPREHTYRTYPFPLMFLLASELSPVSRIQVSVL